ncbi:hypothetical protein MXB_4978 [Myxobolus squamalis]|nr:hypothetical protein MXB_4978 [Myxobolus squamalis]
MLYRAFRENKRPIKAVINTQAPAEICGVKMDFQHRVGAKTGGGGVASASETNKDRRERLRLLALESIDLSKDPYFMKNHLGTFECKLCLTLHANEGSYLAHTQGKKHQQNLARRAAKDVGDNLLLPAFNKARSAPRKFIKIGRPGYKGFFFFLFLVTKQYDPEHKQQSLLFQVDYLEVNDINVPKYRLMAAFEQHVEQPVDKFWTHWNPNTKQFFLQLHFKNVTSSSTYSHPAVGLAPATVTHKNKS